jgi:hypothetical protein
MYSSYSFTTSALDGGEWSASRPGRALVPGKGSTVPIVQEAGWALEPVWTQRQKEKSFRPCRESNLNRPVVQPVARHYTDWGTRLTRFFNKIIQMLNIFLKLNSVHTGMYKMCISSKIVLKLA